MLLNFRGPLFRKKKKKDSFILDVSKSSLHLIKRQTVSLNYRRPEVLRETLIIDFKLSEDPHLVLKFRKKFFTFPYIHGSRISDMSKSVKGGLSEKLDSVSEETKTQ